jgi:capsule polysaccharide export protein KpsE/RkpR
MQIRGTNPNTGEPVDEWGCAVTWMPMLLIENSQQQRQTGAAVESFRNETVKANQENQQLYIQAIQQGVLPTQVTPLNQPINILESGEEQ